ncbi:hypothetical protein ACS0TY_028564 [Phlomoides rotata]
MELKLTQSSLPTAIFNSSSFFPKHFSTLAQKWKLDIQRISWKVQDLTSKKILVHVVKVGETLTSISKLYGVPILEIAAANKETPDVDLVFQGQHLNIPSVAVNPQLCHFEGNKLNEHQSPNESPNWVFHGKQWSQIFTVPLSHRLPLVSNPVLFILVLYVHRIIVSLSEKSSFNLLNILVIAIVRLRPPVLFYFWFPCSSFASDA